MLAPWHYITLERSTAASWGSRRNSLPTSCGTWYLRQGSTVVTIPSVPCFPKHHCRIQEHKMRLQRWALFRLQPQCKIIRTTFAFEAAEGFENAFPPHIHAEVTLISTCRCHGISKFLKRKVSEKSTLLLISGHPCLLASGIVCSLLPYRSLTRSVPTDVATFLPSSLPAIKQVT